MKRSAWQKPQPGFTVHEPCNMCGSKDTCMHIGPPATSKPFWLCWGCFITTPAGQDLALNNIKNALGDINDDEDQFRADEAVARDERGADGDPGPHVQGAEGPGTAA